MTLRAIDLKGIPHMIEGMTTLDEQINSDTTLTVELFDTPVNKPITSKISESWRISGVNGPGDNVEYVVKRKEVKPGRRTKVLTLNCVPYFIEVLNTRRIYTNFEGEYDIKTVLDTVFRALPFSYELNEPVATSKFMDGFGDGQTKLEVFKTALETWELEFKIENGIFKLSKYINRKPDYFISDEINAYNVVQEVDGTNFYTYAKGYGDLGSDDPLESAGIIKEYKHPLADVAQIGIKEAPPLRLEDETNADRLYSKTKKYVDTSLKISITCDFISLQKEWPQAVPKLADETMFKANNINYSQVVRLIAISTKRNHKGDILSQNVTFGDMPLGRRHKANINHAAQFINDLKNGNRKLPSSVLEKAILEASSLILNAQTELDFGSSLGIVARDKTDANNLVVFNAAGVGLSRDGGKTFENAITALGINATAITTGKLLTDLIEVMSESGLFKLTGEKALWTNATDSTRYVEVSPKGLHINKGAFTLTGYDGRRLFEDGRMRNELMANIQIFDTTFDGVNVYTDKTEYKSVYVIRDRFRGNFLELTGTARLVGADSTDANYIDIAVTRFGLDNPEPYFYKRERVTNSSDPEDYSFKMMIDMKSIFNTIVDYRRFDWYVKIKLVQSNGLKTSFRLNRGEWID